MESPTYRAYFFGNLYLSQIQHGIQAAHVVTKLFVKYNTTDDTTQAEHMVLYKWGFCDVTKILLNGGYQSNLKKVYQILEIICPILNLPFEKFHEETDSLNGALTSVGVIVDCSVLNATRFTMQEYENGFDANTVDELLDYAQQGLTPFGAEFVLHRLLKTGRLA